MLYTFADSHPKHPKGYLNRCLGACLLIPVVMMVLAVLVSSCSTQLDVNTPVKNQPKLTETQYTSFDGDHLGYQKWVPGGKDASVKIQTVIIGVHGISGYSGDYENLGKHLLKSNPGTALYAAETRGQGMDPETQRRGDIRRAKDWYRDLYTFTRLIRQLHPKAIIIWFGESMGSMIVLNAYNHTPTGESKPDAMVLSSPIVDVNDQLPPWKYTLARVTAALFPKLRISLETLSDGQEATVTEDDMHEEQAAKNEWYIKRYTLRLLLTLGNMSGSLDEQAATVNCPLLLLHGGLDIFTPKTNVEDLYTHFPETADKTKKFYPGSYHLLMYDHDRDKIFNDISKWLLKVTSENTTPKK